jgi:beta-lactamase class A
MQKKKKVSKNKNFLRYLLTFFIFFVGFSIGLLTAHILFPARINPSLLLRESGYDYINPLIDFDNIDFIKTKEAKSLERQLNTFVKREIQDNPNIKHISVYYRDLNTGVWVGINEKEKFALASLTKVPTLIAHYKYDELNPGHLERKYIYEYDPEEYIGLFEDNRIPGYELEQGKEYTLGDFLDQLITHSDNTVLPYLLDDDLLDDEHFDKIYDELLITNPYVQDNENVITVREYSSFFRILYNATYLSKEMSSKALENLSKSSYDTGLARGIPENIVLANKFGERRYETENGIQEGLGQVHDCGIIYHPTKPYILCVMTEGKNPYSQDKAISQISGLVYKVVDGK